jgi:SAM-dependent methyltransferase
MIEVLEHFPNPVDYIADLARVTAPSGRIIITTPSAYGAKGSKVTLLRRLLWPMKHDKPVLRETYILIQGKKLPHRDFTFDEIRDLFSPYFVIINVHSFNFGIQYLVKRIFPLRFLMWMTVYLESHAAMFPNTWGHNWLILCEKRIQSETNSVLCHEFGKSAYCLPES